MDGLGLRPPAADNPVNAEVCPTLCKLIERHCKPIDACLGIEGAPQSATGQATMFTGVNAAAAMGKHCEGFPGPALRAIVERNNIFLELKRRSLTVKFSDAYLVDGVDELEMRRFKSVTTVMALTSPETISTIDDLVEDRALVQDITRETIQERYPDIPVIPPQRAAEHLFALARKYDFTLFEFFQTDVVGHSMDYSRACAVLRVYDRFLSALLMYADAAKLTIVLTSDHGNIEEMLSRTHTRNEIPFVAYGPKEEFLRERVNSLCDVTPAILSAIDEELKGGAR